jgi:DedD protein
MSVFSFFKRDAQSAPDRAPVQGGDESSEVLAARTRARRRLIGAVVLLGIGIVAFPLIFETQPRPLALDLPIERAGQAAPPPAVPASAAPAVQRSGAVETERADGSAVVTAPAAKLPLTPWPAASATAGAASVVTARPPAASAAQAAAPTPPPMRSAEALRAQALLDGKPVPSEAARSIAAGSAGESGRFVVQAGAYGDSASLRAARRKVEKLGLKTYTQVVQTDAGERTRVRVGPYDTRDEAERAAAQIKGSGLAVNILSLP